MEHRLLASLLAQSHGSSSGAADDAAGCGIAAAATATGAVAAAAGSTLSSCYSNCAGVGEHTAALLSGLSLRPVRLADVEARLAHEQPGVLAELRVCMHVCMYYL
jgi:hypothetical protein